MKFIKSLFSNLLLVATCFLLIFIPLYPKLPVIGVTHTWVYIRLEDFIIAAVLTLWIFLILFKKVKLKTPLTIPIFLFWLVGAISTLHGVLILFPTLPNVFPNVALLNFFRHIEYLSLFFIAYGSIQERKSVNYIIGVLTATMLLVIFYGLGQKYLGFPAYLTGNEEFAKGIPLRISALGRVPSTFAGHYDLAAYLVLMIPIFVSLFFGVRSFFLKGLFLITSVLGFALLLMTVSRVSFFVLIISLLVFLVFQKKKFFLVFMGALILGLLVLSPSLVNRFSNTLTYVNVLVDAKSGNAIGEVKELSRDYFKDKIVFKDNATLKDVKSSSSAVLKYDEIPPIVEFLVPANTSTGENLPQGTGYVNLELSPILRRSDMYFINQKDTSGNQLSQIHAFVGNYLVKRAKAYDLSFTTRFQGEWPRTFDSFKRNIFLGSGYGSVSLAVDNNYLRILGELGLFGLLSFALLFIVGGIFIKKTYHGANSVVVKSLVIGFATGTLGLILNATLIDVFEASKIAFSYWLLAGVIIGILNLESKDIKIDYLEELKKILTSSYAVVLYILIAAFVLFLPLYTNYFVGDDFSWLRWVAQSKENVLNFFFNSQGFFYRPGARIYFLLMYKFFWLNQTFYHLASIILNSIVAILVFALFKKIFSKYWLAVLGAFLFLALSGNHEAVFWISATGFLFSAIFVLLSILSYICWIDNKNKYYLYSSLIFAVLSPMFHEVGIVTPLILIAYDYIFIQNLKAKFHKLYLILMSPFILYLLLRLVSNSQWFSGDYSYNIFKLPFNFVGNAIGYFVLNFLGPLTLRVYEPLREGLKSHPVFALLLIIFAFLVSIFIYKRSLKNLEINDKKILFFGLLFFLISLLPFLGLGNITSRYSYLSSIGFVVIFVFFINKVFSYLRTVSDKYTFAMMSVLFSLIFLSFQLFQLQGIHTDWNVAGTRVQNFLNSFQNIFLLNKYGKYDEYNPKKTENFYFVNTPIKNGEAWIFPVGLSDSLWFALGNSNFSVSNFSNLNDALYKSSITPNSSVFIFNSDGTLRKVFLINTSVMILPK